MRRTNLFLSKRDFVHLFLDDILFYQRPLRSQKSAIGDCILEFKTYKDKDGNNIKEYLKVISKPILFIRNSVYGNGCTI